MVLQHHRCQKRCAAPGWVLCVLAVLVTIHDVCHALSIRTDAKSCMKPLIRSCPASLSGSKVRLMAVQDQNDVDEITNEAENAVKAANVLMSDTDAMTSNSPLKKSIPPPSTPQQRVSYASLSPQAQSQLIAATFSGTAVGAIVSLILESQLDDLAVEPAVITGIVSIAFGAATYVVAKNPDETNLISKSVRYFLGQPLLSLSDQIKQQITSSIERTTEEIKAIPTKIQQSVEQKVDDTVSTIQNIPSNVQRSIEQQIQQTQNAASQKVQETVSSIQQIPNQVKDAALDYADEIVTEIKATPNRVKDAALDIADEIVTEIKATPEKVQKQAAAFIEETIEDISSIPSKIVANVETTVNSATSSTTLPQPPKLPPPLPKSPKVEAQSTPTSFAVPELPKIELPKIDIPKVELPSIPIVDIPMKRAPPTPTKAVIPKDKKIQPSAAALLKQKQQQQQAAAAAAAKQKAQQQEQAAAAAAAKQKAQQQEQAAAAAVAKQKAQQQEQAAAAAAKMRAQKEKEQLEQKKLKLQQAKQAAEQRERQQLIQEEAKEERRRLIAEQERQREQEILRKAQEALQRSREAEERKKRQELERKKQQEEAAKKRQQQLAEQQATAQMQKQQSSTVNGASGSFRVAGVPQNRAPRGVPTIVSWKQRKDGGISGRIYGSTNFVDGERIETSVIVTGTIDNGYVVKTDSGSRYFLSTEKPTTRSATPDSAGPIQTLLSALPGATITLTKSAQEKATAQKEAAAKKKAENVVVKPRPTFSLFGSPVSSTDVSSTGTTKVSNKVAPRGVPTIQRWRKNRDGSVTGIIYGSSNFSDGEQVTTSPIAIGTIASGELVRTGSGSKYFLG